MALTTPKELVEASDHRCVMLQSAQINPNIEVPQLNLIFED